MGLGNFAQTDDEESSGANKSTYITFKNPTTADVNEKAQHRHKQDYYDAAKQLRDLLGQDINVLVGDFLVAASQADDGDTEALSQLFEQIAGE